MWFLYDLIAEYQFIDILFVPIIHDISENNFGQDYWVFGLFPLPNILKNITF
jgi:hypothetical protein